MSAYWLGPERLSEVALNSLLKYLACLAIVGVSLSASVATAADQAKHILVIQSNGQNFKPWSDYVKAFRQRLERQSPWPLAVQNFPVALTPNSEGAESRLADYLNALFPQNPPDLIVAFGAPAAAFVQRHRARLFPGAPTLFAAIDERRVEQMSLTASDAVVSVWIDIPALFGNILNLLPQTTTIAVVIGSSSNERFWAREIEARVGEQFKSRVNL